MEFEPEDHESLVYVGKHTGLVSFSLAYSRHIRFAFVILPVRTIGTKYFGIVAYILIVAPISTFGDQCLYAGSIALVFPSKYESFGIPLLEAMAVDTLIIGTRAVKEAGSDAILYPDDVDSWIAGIQTVSDEREDLVRKGFECVKSFSWQKLQKILQNSL